MITKQVDVETIITADRAGRHVELIVSTYQGQILSIDIYNVSPNVLTSQINFGVKVA